MNVTKLPGWPALVLHELTHAVAAAPFASTRIRLFSDTPHAELRWQEGTPRLAIRLAHLAPTIVGVLTTALTVVTVAPVLSMGLPSNPFHALALALLLGYNWLLYCWPSRQDRRPFETGGGA